MSQLLTSSPFCCIWVSCEGTSSSYAGVQGHSHHFSSPPLVYGGKPLKRYSQIYHILAIGFNRPSIVYLSLGFTRIFLFFFPAESVRFPRWKVQRGNCVQFRIENSSVDPASTLFTSYFRIFLPVSVRIPWKGVAIWDYRANVVFLVLRLLHFMFEYIFFCVRHIQKWNGAL